MGPHAGLVSFCTDLDIDPSDIRMLVFCFYLEVLKLATLGPFPHTPAPPSLSPHAVNNMRVSLTEPCSPFWLVIYKVHSPSPSPSRSASRLPRAGENCGAMEQTGVCYRSDPSGL
jgi:hypothetical protein